MPVEKRKPTSSFLGRGRKRREFTAAFLEKPMKTRERLLQTQLKQSRNLEEMNRVIGERMRQAIATRRKLSKAECEKLVRQLRKCTLLSNVVLARDEQIFAGFFPDRMGRNARGYEKRLHSLLTHFGLIVELTEMLDRERLMPKMYVRQIIGR